MNEVDIRGEPCGMPVLRVEKFLLENSGGAVFASRTVTVASARSTSFPFR